MQKLKIFIAGASSWIWRDLLYRFSWLENYEIIAWFPFHIFPKVCTEYKSKGIKCVDLYFSYEYWDYADIFAEIIDCNIFILSTWRIWYGETTSFSMLQLREMLEVNVVGNIELISHLYREITEGEPRKKIILLSSVAWEVYIPGISIYSACKSFLNTILQHMVEECKTKIDIYNLLLWPYDTTLSENSLNPKYTPSIISPRLICNTELSQIYQYILKIISWKWEQVYIIDDTIFKEKLEIIILLKKRLKKIFIWLYSKIWN